VRVIEPGQFATELGSNSVYAAAMGAGTPEYERHERFHAAQRTLVSGNPPSAQIVADAIYAAATEEPGRLRHPVGDDAALVLAVKSQMSFEEFDHAMRTTLNWFD